MFNKVNCYLNSLLIKETNFRNKEGDFLRFENSFSGVVGEKYLFFSFQFIQFINIIN